MGLVSADILARLRGMINQDGSIMSQYADTIGQTIQDLKDVSGVDITTVEIDGVEHIAIGETAYTSLNDFTLDYEEDAQNNKVTTYFDSHNWYVGVVDSTPESAKTFIKALCAASGADLHLNDLLLVDVAWCEGFAIQAIPSLTGNPAQISIADSDGQQTPIDLFIDPDRESKPYIKYFIYRGTRGDCYFKGFNAADTTIPSLDDAEEYFKDVSIGGYRIRTTYDPDTGDPVDVFEVDNQGYSGGCAIIKMEDKFEGGSSHYDVALLQNHGGPLTTFSVFNYDDIVNYSNSFMDVYSQSSLYDNDGTVFPAPIYSPLSGLAASSYSYWALIAPKYGYYYLGIGYNQFVCDHGFLLAVR